MKYKSHLCVALVMCCALYGCSTAPRPSTSASVMPPGYDWVEEFHMLTSRHGWAERQGKHGFHILRTTDGAQTWTDVTPPVSKDSKIWDCQFPKTNLAWISFYENGETRLLLTTNAGESWAPWTPVGSFDNSTHNFFLKTDDCRFFNASNGVAMDIDVGACQATYNYFETHDGGSSWEPARFSDKYPIVGEPTGTILGSDCDGSAVSYYPPGTIVIAQGDLADEKAKGVVRLCLSTDSGNSWRHLAFPLPEKYRDRLVRSFAPYFFDTTNALMPVLLLKNATNGFKDGMLVFYSTCDGGNTWSARRGILKEGDVLECDYVSPRDIYLRWGGSVFYATHDGAGSWQQIKVKASVYAVNQLNFIDAAHGWVTTYDDDPVPKNAFKVYKTSNGGNTWTQLPLSIFGIPPTMVSAH